jgi:RNA polymerase sigma-70 factor (ECF subfamily)
LNEVNATCGDVNVEHIDVARCIQRLPEIQRDIIMLFYFQEQSVEDVGRMLDLPINTVKSHLRRARQVLAEMLKEQS